MQRGSGRGAGRTGGRRHGLVLDRRRRQVVRRRRAVALAVALLAVVVLWLALSAGTGDEEDRMATDAARDGRPAAPRPSLDRQVGALMLLSFQGTTVPSYVADALRGGRATGAIVFDRNVSSPDQVKALTGGLQRAGGGRALVATDQEGGEARTLPYAAPTVSQSALAGPRAAAASARRSARDLRAAGINVALAPVADVGVPGGALTARTYPGDPAAVADSVRAGVEGYRPAGVAATLKHFPGLGAAPANTDDAPVTLPATRERIEERDLPPFGAGIEAGAPLVMVSHALYPALDRRSIASQSRPIVDGVLRRRLGFRGVAVTDSIEADAVLQRSSVEQAAVRSVAAGVDLVLMTGPGSFPRVRRALLREARRSPTFRRRVEESAARVNALKDRLGPSAP